MGTGNRGTEPLRRKDEGRWPHEHTTARRDIPVSPTLPSAESYSFDATGNRNLSGGGSSSAADSHSQVQNDGTYTYDYDNEGNQIRRTEIATGNVTEYSWDYRNRLIEVTERGSAVGPATRVVNFQYDAFDRRTGKQIDVDADGTIDRAEAWVWQGDQVALQLIDADGDGAGTWKLTILPRS